MPHLLRRAGPTATSMFTQNHLSKSMLPILAVALLLSACSPTIVWDYPRTPSNTFAYPQTTTVGALFQEAADEHPGRSGFSLIREGAQAFMARLAMADLAEKTLDGQYYIWDGDTTGLILADRLLRAADRGVRVRLLIDDHYMSETRDASSGTHVAAKPHQKRSGVRIQKTKTTGRVSTRLSAAQAILRGSNHCRS